jgi:uncharacterized surface protein with fasciclin (FAS1) repeats
MKALFVSLITLALLAPGANATASKSDAKSAESNKSKIDKSAAELNIPFIKMDGAEGKDIVEVAKGSPDHKSLVKAVVAADLVETLTGPGPYTIFAPTDAAFGKVPKATVDKLFDPKNKADLKALLEHHAAAPAYKVEILSGLTELDMVDGPKLKVTKTNGKLYVDDVEIKAAIGAKNGIVYVVDTVLVPK